MGIGPRKPKCPTFCTRYFSQALAKSMHKTGCRRARECPLLNKRKVEELLDLLVFGVLEVKDNLDKTGMKRIDIKRQKLWHACIEMDALLGSSVFIHV